MLYSRLGNIVYRYPVFMKRTVAVFDFDGTLTCSDTLLPFMKFALGKSNFIIALLLNFPWLVAYACGIYPNWKAKQRLFSTCFSGWTWERFCKVGERFADSGISSLRPEMISALEEFLRRNASVYIITASMEPWVKPMLAGYPSLVFLTTRPEVVNGVLSGKFAGGNCYGPEKKRRLLEVEPCREDYTLYVYGDSRGDRELLEWADYSYWRVWAEK